MPPTLKCELQCCADPTALLLLPRKTELRGGETQTSLSSSFKSPSPCAIPTRESGPLSPRVWEGR
eukprot:7878002-Pyramimonas_sp.AAC.1